MVVCPSEITILYALVPLIALVISIIILWYYATRSAESLIFKILNIGIAVLIDAFILATAITLFFSLNGCPP